MGACYEMNYAQARQRESDKRWDWTVRNGHRIMRAEPCRSHDDGHATMEEAERHFWEWEVSQPLYVYQQTMQAQCGVCSAWTQDVARLWDGYTLFVLCDAHQDRASLEHVHPFASGRYVMYS